MFLSKKLEVRDPRLYFRSWFTSNPMLEWGCLKTRVTISGVIPSWRPVARGVPQRSILDPVLFNAWLIVWMMGQSLQVCSLSKSADDTKLRGEPNTPEGHSALQRVLNRMEKWAIRNLMKFNKEECKILHLGRNSPVHQYILGASWLKSSFLEKGSFNMKNIHFHRV